MTIRLASIILILILSCNNKPSEWQTLDFNSFKLRTPLGWYLFEENGLDAYAGGITNKTDSLWFYYGMYTSGPNEEEALNHLFGQDTINGHSATLMIPKHQGKGKIAMFIPDVTESNKFFFSGINIKDPETVLKIFKSVTFKNSDTTQNSKLMTTKFKEFPFGSGYSLFKGYCAGCHSLEKNLFGPALKTALEDKSSNWLDDFLKSKTPINRNDSIINSEHRKITWLDTLTLEDIQQIIGFVNSK